MKIPSMTPKERILAALHGEKTDILPAAPAYLCIYLEDDVRRRYTDLYRLHLGERSRCGVDHQQDTAFRLQALLEAYDLFAEKPDTIESLPGVTRSWAERTQIAAVDGELFYEDLQTGRRLPMRTAPMPTGDRGLLNEGDLLSEWQAARPPQTEAEIDARVPILSCDELLAGGEFDLPRLLLEARGEQFFVYDFIDPPFSLSYDVLGFEGQMLYQHDHPELFAYLLERLLLQQQERICAFAAIGLHGVYIQEVWTGADLISPRAYERWVQPSDRRFCESLRASGLASILYVCGDVMPRLDAMCAYDVDALAVEESKKGFQIEIDEVVRRIDGRRGVWGNIDAVHFGLEATPDEMAAEVRRQTRVGQAARGFVVSTGSPFPLHTPLAQIEALISTAHSIPG